ncbi:sialate O-acetylesterase [Pontiella sulfatireligans]|uniref:Sialate O-acetylesterase domain-containing protein n=1 Tax=Pontiella sulfatireligans TaxID=2750658 RepID=A0A6C2UNZ8_9BACT|nr:sialate O-acetylesterase [Pontiella sulfatireligans]VGO21985.1 hypothetical protein SCARR_04065 [Pontiella sulfatireligans]
MKKVLFAVMIGMALSAQAGSISSDVVKINFQPATFKTPAGWLADSGQPYSAARGYGWDCTLMNRERNKSDDKLFDTIVGVAHKQMEATFTADQPNGEYQLSIQLGDPLCSSSFVLYLQAGDEPVEVGKTLPGECAIFQSPVTVVDGKLTIRFVRNGSPGISINWLALGKNALTRPSSHPAPGSTLPEPPKQTVTLPDVFSDNMILQRDVPVPVWGEAESGTQMTVSFGGYDLDCTARDGKWRVVFPPMPASSKPRKLQISSFEFQVSFTNILIGDIWLASGQSNMEYYLCKAKGGKEAIANSKNPMLRLFKVRREIPRSPQIALSTGHWEEAGPDSVVTKFATAVGYSFVRELQEALDIPIGLINCSYGGTVTETWCSPDVLEQGWPEWEAQEEKNRQNPKSMKVNASSHLYERMLKTVIPFPVKGFIWYQGSANIGRFEEQKSLLPAMVDDWRKSWGNDELPFFFVQLPRFEQQNWHVFRNAQLNILKNNPNTFMAVTIDLSREYDDGNHPIHPNDKAPVGHRLALAARANVYGETDLVYTGPVIQSMQVKKGAAVLSFDHTGSGLIASDNQALRGFYISADGETFVEADAQIKGVTVVVHSSTVRNPIAVRYGADLDMGKETLDVNLANKEQLPASPFTVHLSQ